MANWEKNLVRNCVYNCLSVFGNTVPNCINDPKYKAFMTTTKVGVQSIVTRGPAGTGFWIDWDDGNNPEWIQHLGIGTDVTTNHTYAAAGTKYQKWIGDLSQITSIDIHSQSYIFNIAEFLKFTNLQRWNCHTNPNLTGDPSIMAALPLTYIYCYGCSGLIGSINSWSVLTGVTSISMGACPGFTGNLSNLSTLTSLTTIVYNSCYGLDTVVLDDILQFSSIVSITGYVKISSYTTCTIKNTVRYLLIYSCGLSTAEVDQIILDIDASGAINGTLSLAGTNDPHTTGGAVDAAITSLAVKGWVVTVN